jgi:hypothetical protein
MKKLAALIAIAAAVGLAPRPAAAQTLVTCESVNGQRQLCRAETSGGVSIHRQLSSTPCVQGRNWNVGNDVIWVTNGCRAQFVVNDARRGRYNDGRNNDGRYDNDRSDNRNVDAANVACRRAVRAQLGRRVEVSTWGLNSSRNSRRVGWRIANGRSGECRIDRGGNLSVLVNRNR